MCLHGALKATSCWYVTRVVNIRNTSTICTIFNRAVHMNFINHSFENFQFSIHLTFLKIQLNFMYYRLILFQEERTIVGDSSKMSICGNIMLCYDIKSQSRFKTLKAIVDKDLLRQQKHCCARKKFRIKGSNIIFHPRLSALAMKICFPFLYQNIFFRR